MKKISNITRKIVTLLLVVILSVSFVTDSVNAAETWTRRSDLDYSYSTGAMWCKKTYNCKAYKETAYIHYLIFYGNTTCSTGFDYKPNMKSPITISQTSSFQIGAQTTASLNANVGVEDAGVKAGFGSSISATTSCSWGVSNTVSRTVDKTDPIGYYSYNILINTDKYKVTGTSLGTIKFVVPTSQPYRAIVYSKTGNYSDASRSY